MDGGIIERTVAYNNGILCPAANGGPVGIWEYDSNNVLIQHSESYSNHTGGPDDGGGFDLDISSTNSVMQYNYSHDNDGAGFGLYQDSGPVAWTANIVRYNISENDGRKNGYGAITLWTGGGSFSNAEIFNNTIYVSPDPSRTTHAIRINSASSGFHFRNNLILATGGMRLLEVPPAQTDLLFQGNDYFSYGGAFSIVWNGATYASLAAFQNATGQEIVGTALSGKSVDPLLTNPGAGGTIGVPNLLETLTAYKLRSGSPMIDAGLNLSTLFSVNPGPQDFYGTLFPQGAAFDIGANEFNSGTVNRPPTVTAAGAAPNSVSGNTTLLSATATDDGGESALVYAWSVISAPSGGAVGFSANNTNAAKTATAAFAKAGSYALQLTARDKGGLTGSLDVSVNVVQTLTSISVTPATASLRGLARQQYAAAALDQFGPAMSAQPAFAWSVSGPRNVITQTGMVRAGATAGVFTVTATAGGGNGTAALQVTRR